jgi:hypothetical protein
MKSSRRSKNFRACVPVLLNGHLVQFYFDRGEPNIRLEVNVRQYSKNEVCGNWLPKRLVIQFEKRMITHQPDQNVTVFGEKTKPVVETLYACDNNRIRFEQEQIPFINE